MLYYENNEWHLSKHKVIYTDNGGRLENYVGIGGKQWWEDLAKQHDGINIVEFAEITATTEQLKRLDTINQLNVPDGHGTTLANYVLDGNFPNEASHVLKDLETSLLKAENKLLKGQAKAITNELDFTNDVLQEMIMTSMKAGG